MCNRQNQQIWDGEESNEASWVRSRQAEERRGEERRRMDGWERRPMGVGGETEEDMKDVWLSRLLYCIRMQQ